MADLILPTGGQIQIAQLASMIELLNIDVDSLWRDDEIVDRFLAKKEARSRHTRIAYEMDISQFRSYLHLEHMGGESDGRLLRTIDSVFVDSYHHHLTEQVAMNAIAKSTANRRIAGISSLFSWGAERDYRKYTGILANPVVVDRYKVHPDFSSRTLTVDEVRKLLQVARYNGFPKAQRNAALIDFLYASGCRVSECAILKWKHLKSVDKGATVRLLGKRDKIRYVIIRPSTWNELRAMDVPQGSSNYVFPNQKGGPVSRDTIAKILLRVGESAGIKPLTPHMLRHSYATHAVQAGVPINQIQQDLGHTNLNTTQGYLQANPQDSSGLHLPE